MRNNMNHPERISINDKAFKVFISQEEIEKAVKSIADRINNDYAGKTPLFLLTLKGAVFFAVDLLKQIQLDCEIETISAKSYGSEMTSSGNVKVKNLDARIKGRDIIILEDIIDSGFTIKALLEELSKQEPNSIEVATFLSKPEMLKTNVSVKYVGIEIPPRFVVGYGLDYAEKGRQYPVIYILDED